MNLTNKTVTVTALSVYAYPPVSSVTVSVTEEILDGVFKTIGTYEMKFDMAFLSASDPALLQLIHDKLALIPDA